MGQGSGDNAPRGRLYNRTFRVDDRAWDRLHATAFANGESVSDVLRRAIDQYNEQEQRWTV